MKRHWQVLGVVVLVSLVVTSVLTGCGASPESVSTLPGPEGSYAPVSQPTAGPAADKGPGEAIKVHGHWTIEVRNADGTIAEVRDFENALWEAGSEAMANVLGRTRSVGGWQIELRGGPLIDGAFLTAPLYAGFIQEIGGQNATSGPGYFETLTVNVPSTGANADKLVLSGTAIALRNGNIYQVGTKLHLLPNTQVPSPTYGEAVFFTSTNLSGGSINLLAGQQVLVTVVISFS